MSTTRKLLILDLDETLVHATEGPAFGPAHFRLGSYHVYRRPHLDTLLAAASDWFDLAVWTSAGSDYASLMCDAILPQPKNLKFAWSRDRCTSCFDAETLEIIHAKNLGKVRRLGHSLEQVLMLDDSPEKLARHYGNLIRVRSFFGDPADTELRDLLPFLEWIKDQPNVRTIEKRGWRGFAQKR